MTSRSKQSPLAAWIAATLTVLVCLNCPGQQPATSPADKPAAVASHEPDTVEEARTNLKAAETAHPGNTPEVADAIVDVVELEMMAEPTTDQTLATIQRAMAVAEAARGKESGLYTKAMAVEAWVYLKMDRQDLARPVAEDALALAKKTGEPHPIADAAAALSNICGNMGDDACSLENAELAAKLVRTIKDLPPLDLTAHLNDLAEARRRNKDIPGAAAAVEEILAVAAKEEEKQNLEGQRWATVENNAGSFYIYTAKYETAISHLRKAVDLDIKAYGPDTTAIYSALSNLAYSEACANHVDEAVKDYERARVVYAKMYGPKHTMTASLEEGYASVLNFMGRYQEAADLALDAHRVEREHIRSAIRLLPERQALALSNEGFISFNVALSVATLHPEIRLADVYQEVARSRALVAEEMAQREAALSRKQDPAIAALEKEMDDERRAVMELQGGAGAAQSLSEATEKMERTERELASHSAAFRTGERARSSDLADLRKNMPPKSTLISYARYTQYQMKKEKFGAKFVQSYAAFALHPDSEKVSVYDLGTAKDIDDLVSRMRASADAEAHSTGLGSARNEREYRDAATALRKLIWDPLEPEWKNAETALVVPDGVLNLIPFGGLPDGKGYLVERGPVIHMLTTERDLIPAGGMPKKAGLVAVGSPAFELAQTDAAPSTLRDAPVDCEAFNKIEFNPLPASMSEVREISTTWKRWNRNEPEELLTGDKATRTRFLEAASQSRILHVATHAFVLDQACGNGNPLLHSGLVFAGANKNRNASILTAQQIASLDLTGVDWAVLSACNTGNGELKDGEGVLGLERSFRVAGAKSVVMTLWPVDDEVTREFMRGLYAQRFGRHATTANATWIASRNLLKQRRAAGKNTHPWYWAGFVGAGDWH